MLKRFFKETGGNVMVLIAFMAVPILTLTGGASDVGRAYMLREKLQETLDSATLHGVRYLGKPTIGTEIQRFIDLNFPPTNSDINLNPISYVEDEDEKTLTVNVVGTVSSSFLHLIGIENMTVAAQSKAQLSDPIREVVMVLDNTGSMGADYTSVGSIRDCSSNYCNKVQSMKYAAKLLLDTVSTDGELPDNFYLGMVPYTTNVNIRPDNEDWTTGTTGLDFGQSGWRGCVMARHQNGNDMTDATPAEEPFVPFRWPSTYGQLYYPNHDTNNDPYVYYGRLVIGDNNWYSGNEKDSLSECKSNSARGPNVNCPTEMTPLTTDFDTIEYNISLMNGFSRGGTMANIGLAWGYRMLSPKWRGLWWGGTPPELPTDFEGNDSIKTLILLTDGDNLWYDWPGSYINAYTAQDYINQIGQAAWDLIESFWNNGAGFHKIRSGAPGRPLSWAYPDADFTSYGRLSEGRLGTTNKYKAKTIINSRMLSLCSTIKNNGVDIYTITFGSGMSSSTQTLYETCATDESQYFHAPDTQELASTFKNIGAKLKKIRLIK